MRRPRFCLFGALALVLLAAACNGGTTANTTAANGGGATTSSPGATTGPTAPPSAGAVTKGSVPARFDGYRSELYSHDENWLCRPGIAQNYCLTENLDSTVLNANGSTQHVARTIVKDAPVDCFYVYPTVNLKAGGGNDMGMSDEIGVEAAVLRTQGARFTETCNVYAPLYRQMELSAYSSPEPEREKADAIAYGDVHDAFKDYMANYNKGKPVVLIGHSQGSGHLAHLMQDEFDNDPAMRSQLVSALLIGGSVKVAAGKEVGGTFKNIPLCSSASQTACVVTYNSFNGDAPPPNDTFFGRPDADGNVPACVNPAAPGGGSATLKTYIAGADKIGGAPKIDDPFVQTPDAMTGECKTANGVTYFGISAATKPGDTRDVSKLVENVPGWGLHITEFNLTMGSLLDLVRSQIAALH